LANLLASAGYRSKDALDAIFGAQQRFVSPIAWKYLGRVVDLKEQIGAGGSFRMHDVRIDPRIRKYLQGASSSGTLSLGPM
jgi:hypothetical protein